MEEISKQSSSLRSIYHLHKLKANNMMIIDVQVFDNPQRVSLKVSKFFYHICACFFLYS